MTGSTPGASLTVDEKVSVAKQLARLRVDVIEAGFPAASPGEADAVERIASEVGGASGAPAIAALARGVRGGRDDRRRRRSSPRHGAENPRLHRDQRHPHHPQAAQHGPEVLDASRLRGAGRDGWSDPSTRSSSAPRTLRAPRSPSCSRPSRPAVSAGASVINVPDTVGYTEPKEFGGLVQQVVELVGRRAIVSTHCHNDLGLATAKRLAGIQAGARQVEVTINGLGERAGNASLEEVVMALRTRPGEFHGATTNVATEQITATSRLASFLTGIPVQPNKSIVGANAFAHESGIHQDGFLKNPLTYEIMTPESVGLSGSTLTLGKLSGRAGFDERLRQLGIHVEPDELDRLYGEAISLADRKKQVTDADLLALVEQHADPVPVLVELEHWATASRQGESSSGNVSIFYGGQDLPRLLRRQRSGRRAPLRG